MKEKKHGSLLKIFGITLFACLAFGCMGIQEKTVKADSDVQSVGDRYFYTTSGQLESFLNKSAVNQALYKGVRTEISGLTVGEDVTVYYNGLISPTAANKGVIYYDEYNVGTMDAEGIVWTYTLAKDRSKQLSIVTTQRNSNYYVSLALTDDIEFRDGYAYIAGTQQKTVSLSAIEGESGYTEEGYLSKNERGPLHSVGLDGAVYEKEGPSFANFLSEEFLDKASENLAGTKYEELYTTENARAILDGFGTGAGNNTSILSITYKSVRCSTVCFNLRGISGQWIGDNGGVHPWNGGNSYGFATQKKTTVYKNAENNLADLFNLHTVYVASGETETNPYGVGYYGTDANGNGGTWFNIEDGLTTAAYKTTEYGKFYVKLGAYIAPNYAALGCYSPTTVFEFDVVDGNPEIKGIENATAIEGMTYPLTSFFDIWCLGEKEKATVAFEIDGVATNESKFTADGEDHEIKIDFTDEYGNASTCTHKIKGATLKLQTSISVNATYGLMTVFPVPQVLNGVSYTVILKNSNDEVISEGAASYIFEQEGVYTLEYQFITEGADPLSKTVDLFVTLKHEEPEIIVSGEYNAFYYEGFAIDIFSAIARDSLNKPYDVTMEVSCNEEAVTVSNYKLTANSAGEYKVKYSCVYGNGEETTKELSFTVIADEEAPEIVVKGSYASVYGLGKVVAVFDYLAVDNSNVVAETTRKVYLNDTELTVDNDMLSLSKEGTYKVLYTAKDLAGNLQEVSYTFIVEDENAAGEGDKKGCNGCSGTLSISGVCILTIFAAVVVIFRKKGKEEY